MARKRESREPVTDDDIADIIDDNFRKLEDIANLPPEEGGAVDNFPKNNNQNCQIVKKKKNISNFLTSFDFEVPNNSS